MKAAVYERTGPAAEVLRVADVTAPEPGPGEVRVRVQASGINPTDVKTRGGATPRPIDGFQIPHQDGAGVIDAVGPGVRTDRVGQRVWVWLAASGRRWGTAAEWTVVPERQAVPLPDGVSIELGASLGVPGHDRAPAACSPTARCEDSAVLVAGGAGAVGHFAVQLAVWGGAAQVLATVSSPAKAAAGQGGRGRGRGQLPGPGRGRARSRRRPGRWTGSSRWRWARTSALDLAVSRPDTVVVSYAAEASDPVLPVRACMTANIVLRFMLLYTVPAAALDQAVADISAALQAGALTELPVHRFALDEIVAAQEAVERGVGGKVLVIP